MTNPSTKDKPSKSDPDYNGPDKATRFQQNNEFWKARSSHGRNPIFETSDELWNACAEYFQWVEDNPLYAAEVVKYQGLATLTAVPKMRAMTIESMCIFIDISEDTWKNYAAKPDFLGVTTRAESIIRSQKFQGAAAEMLNPNIIARDLGLKDQVDHNVGLKVVSHDPIKKPTSAGTE